MRMWLVLLSLVVSVTAGAAHQPPASERSVQVDALLSACEKNLIAEPGAQEKAEILKSGERLLRFFDAVEQGIVERDYAIESLQRALIGRQPVLLVGPPGNAKTKLITYALGNIIDEDTGKPSFFTDQMTFETTISDTHGSLDFKTLMDSGRQERFYDEGILGHHFVLLDEQFDMRPNAYRNVLTALAENRHRDHFGKTWTIVGASNKSIPEVYARFDIYDDSARALVDRYAYVIYVGKELIGVKSNRHVIQSASHALPALPPLSVQDLKRLNALTEQVQIPDHVADLLAYLDFNLSPILESREAQSLANYLEKVKRGEKPSTPPWKSTKYMSPRTLGRAGVILASTVVHDWVVRGGQRALVASIEDLENLLSFYSLNGPEDDAISFLLSRTTKDTEKEQLGTIQLERKIFQELYGEGKDRFNQAVQDLTPVQDLMAKARSYRVLKPEQKKEFEEEIRAQFLNTYAAREVLETAPRSELTPELIAQASVFEVIVDIMRLLYPKPAVLKKTMEAWIESMGGAPAPTPASAQAAGGHEKVAQLVPLTKDDVELIAGSASVGLRQEEAQGNWQMAANGGEFLLHVNGKLVMLSSTLLHGRHSWSGDLDFAADHEGRILWTKALQNIHIGSRHLLGGERVTLTFSGISNTLVEGPYIIFTAESGKREFHVVSSKDKQGRLIKVDGANSSAATKDINATFTKHTTYDFNARFSWEASNGDLFTLDSDLTALWRLSGESFESVPVPELSAGNKRFIGRIGDRVFLVNTESLNLLELDPAKGATMQVEIKPPMELSSPLWISKLGAKSLGDGEVALWEYRQEQGLYLTALRSSGAPKSQLVLGEQELRNWTRETRVKVLQLFESGNGDVLLLVHAEESGVVHAVKVPADKIQRKP